MPQPKGWQHVMQHESQASWDLSLTARRAEVLCDVKPAGAGALAVCCADCAPMLRTKPGGSLVALKPWLVSLNQGVLLDSIGLGRC